MGKRQRKAFDAERLKAQKGKAEKGPRIPASIGFGKLCPCVLVVGPTNAAVPHIWKGASQSETAWVWCCQHAHNACGSGNDAGLAKKRKQQEAVALEQAIEAGMVVRKGLAKKRKAAEKDRKKIELGTR